ncbi:hypothetical protein [Levilactobacillus brevis]|uniref:hypothetical protein n=1 Tax=Levilactobacillus brevis TaxID=1580 RepID=UPI000B3E711D|nr:hypothetical protein [Levilactobacillus brevis]ARW21862.1 hypothetical protein S101174_01023 [Levilactobacillus brevis]
MKLTIHKQLGDTAIDTTIEGGVDDCLKVIDHLNDHQENKNLYKKIKIEIKSQMDSLMKRELADLKC